MQTNAEGTGSEQQRVRAPPPSPEAPRSPPPSPAKKTLRPRQGRSHKAASETPHVSGLSGLLPSGTTSLQ